jgi:hypothetical protein
MSTLIAKHNNGDRADVDLKFRGDVCRRARGTVSRLASQKPVGAVEAILSPRYRSL